MVKQHLDLETVKTRLQKGAYSSCTLAFYRDLLLLFNNAALFFPKSSPESIAAHQLRHLVLNEIPKYTDSSPKEHPLTPDAAVSQPKPELERSDSLLAKHKASAPIIVCRKRSSILAKPSSSAASFGPKDKEGTDEKSPKPPPINPRSDAAVEDDNVAMKTNAKEKPVTGARSLRRSNKNPATNNTNTSSSSSKKQTSTSPSSKASLANKVESTPKADNKKKAEALALEKKRSAADFLRRIKRNSPAETLKPGGKELKTRHSGRGNSSRNERVLRQSSDKKLVKEEGSPSKRSVGRPPKKAAKANTVSVKRGKDSAGKEAASSKRPRKRPRR